MEWISIKESLPEADCSVLVTTGKYIVIADWYSESQRFSPQDREDAIAIPHESFTHWMPLPAQPKERANEQGRELTFDETLAPIREAVTKSGLSDNELYELIADERNQMHEERRWDEAKEKGFPTKEELLDTLTHCRRTIPSDSAQHFFNLDLIRQIVRRFEREKK